MDERANFFDGEVAHALLKHLLVFREQSQRRAGCEIDGSGGHLGVLLGARIIARNSSTLKCWCPEPDSNRHTLLRAADFKSAASTNFATGAGTARCVSSRSVRDRLRGGSLHADRALCCGESTVRRFGEKGAPRLCQPAPRRVG